MRQGRSAWAQNKVGTLLPIWRKERPLGADVGYGLLPITSEEALPGAADCLVLEP